MHEMSIVLSVFRIIREKLKEMYGAYFPVKHVRVVIGRLSTVVPASFEFWFENAGKGTIFEGAGLEIEEVPLKVFCNTCRQECILDEPVFFCRKCDSLDLKIISGRELNVDSFEIDQSAEPIPPETITTTEEVENNGDKSRRKDPLKK